MITRIQETGPESGHQPRRPSPHQVEASIETTRLSLTALRSDDLEDYIAIFAARDSARMSHGVPHPLPREAALARLTGMMATKQTHWAIRNEDERLIGVISLTRGTCGTGPDSQSFGPNLSIFIAPGQQGQGYALEAMHGLLRWVKKHHLHRIIHAAHFADNAASASLLVAGGFLYTGRRTLETSLAREGQCEALHMIRIL
ncbi:GNAT family N-acetyltransferase [Asticcacaulis sp. EMRT-3]|uniref:GNAT family N-acetyltransferase n=1 Tax=Asticcacaulis sp. EMRT-3 TaxID=3040349 RepID=UPI0024AEFF08|nr:GNAT family N-acetyltransferase [Asticcacaulis sp. EMRT-3]MDI7775732.1 GNAT family N-acetyltransferase [Asticcacaulis sp. EMRT-3]